MPDSRAQVERIRQSLQAGRPSDAKAAAEDWFRRAPQQPDAAFWLANTYLALNQAAEALPLLERVARQAPSSADVHNNLGVALRKLGRDEEAFARFQKAIQFAPQHAEAHESLGQLLRGHGHHEKAAEHFLTVLRLAPQFRSAWTGLGECLRSLGRREEAIQVYQKLVERYPKDHYAWNNLGVVLQETGRLEDAAGAFTKAVQAAPDYAEGLAHLAGAWQELGRSEEALSPASRAHQLRPDLPHAANNLAIILLSLGRSAEALPLLESTVSQNPGYLDARHNLATARYAQGHSDAALADLSSFVREHPDFPNATFNLATMLLCEGRYQEGWPLYERRPTPWRSRFSSEPWDGVVGLAGKTLLLHAEQGLGDTLNFARFAPLLAAKGARVIFEVQPALLPVLGPLASSVELIPRGATPPAHDLHLPLLSAAGRLHLDQQSIPPPGPWVDVSKEVIQKWTQRLGPEKRPRLGLVWSGNPAHRNDRNRSLPLVSLIEVLAGAPYSIVTLQKDVRASDRAALARMSEWRVLGDELADFADTAGVLKQIDLLLTVDTSVAHLAGALGVPTWLLLPTPPDWRWLRTGNETPWYPGMRLWRQTRPGDWTELLRSLQVELANPGGLPQADR